MYKLAFFDTSKKEERYLREELGKNKNISVSFYKNHLNKKSLNRIKDINILSASSKIDKEIIERLPKLKLITTMSTGFDHIDLNACKEKNITVSNVPLYGEKTVAEHTFALILSLSRKIPESIENVRNLDFRVEDIQGFDLENKTIGLIGIGHIGAHVAKIANSFDMKIIASDPKPDKKILKKFNIEKVSLEELLTRSEIISIHAPLNQSTYHLINKNNIKLIRPGAYLINTARGAIIETSALVYALEKGIIAGAGLDVLEEEYFIKEEKEIINNPNHSNQMLKTAIQNHLLLKNPKVIITPHNAFNSKEALQRILDTTVANIESFIKNRPINVVKK